MKKLKEQMIRRNKRSFIKKEDSRLLVPSGSIMLNLACSDTINGAYVVGKVVNLIGDSSSGKTLLALSGLAEMVKNSKFDEYRLIYDDAENACEFGIEKLFGKKVFDRVEPAYKDSNNNWCPSDTIEAFYANVQEILNSKKPFIYVLDSLDSIGSFEEKERAEEILDAIRKDKGISGSYRMQKARLLSEILRNIVKSIKDTKSLVLIVSQTRDDIGSRFGAKTRSGGRALKFYSSHEIWLSVKDDLKKGDYIIGREGKVKIAKNKLTGKLRRVGFKLYYDYGVDDIGDSIDYLITNDYWQLKKRTILVEDFKVELTRDVLIEYIEKENKEKELFNLVQNKWNEIEEGLKLNRKSKF